MTLSHSAFHAGGEDEFCRVIENDASYARQRAVEKRGRFEALLTMRVDEFRGLGYWGRQKVLRAIHAQVEREFSTAYCLF